MKRRYLLPRVDKSDILFEFADELSIDNGAETYMVTADSSGVWVSCGPLAEDVGHDPVGVLADLIGCSTSEAEPMLRQHFAERFGKPPAQSLEFVIMQARPGLANLVSKYPQLNVPIKFSPRLDKALRHADSRAASRAYFQDESTRSDGQAFAAALVNGTELDESRASLLALIGCGDLRREVSDSASAVHFVALPETINSITKNISPRAQVDFTAMAIGFPRSRFALAAASRCGITATGHDGATAFHQMLSEVQRSAFAAPRTAVERLIAGGPIAGLAVRKTPPLIRELKQLGDATRTCLGNPAHPWRDRIVAGQVELLTLHTPSGEIAAIVAIGPNGDIREAKSPGNGQIEPTILEAIKRSLEEPT